jgi:hypothetical protein
MERRGPLAAEKVGILNMSVHSIYFLLQGKSQRRCCPSAVTRSGILSTLQLAERSATWAAASWIISVLPRCREQSRSSEMHSRNSGIVAYLSSVLLHGVTSFSRRSLQFLVLQFRYRLRPVPSTPSSGPPSILSLWRTTLFLLL